MDLRFLKVFTAVMDIEGGGAVHKVTGDPGGRTAWGIAETFHPDLFIPDPPTLTEAIPWYYNEYWLNMSLDLVQSSAMCFELFEWAINKTVRKSVLDAQEAANRLRQFRGDPSSTIISVDGLMGPKTLSSLNGLKNVEGAWVFYFNQRQVRYYESRPSDKRHRFLSGWVNRRTRNPFL